LQRLQLELVTEKEIIISCSFVVDREKVNLNTLMTALFCDLTTEKDKGLPKNKLIKKIRNPYLNNNDNCYIW
jgi:type II secretory pathway predicted ATPase ExeA